MEIGSNMSLSLEMLARLRSGQDAAAEIASHHTAMRSYVLVIPQAPKRRENPAIWRQAKDSQYYLVDAASITGYEIRYLLHHEKYTDTNWGLDYDYVLDDETTRVRRVFLRNENEIEAAIERFGADVAALCDPDNFDSSLLNSPIDYYLDRPMERPHLWQE